MSRLELLGLGRVIVDPVLLGLGREHVLADEGCYPFDVILHFLDVFSGGSERGKQTLDPRLMEKCALLFSVSSGNGEKA